MKISPLIFLAFLSLFIIPVHAGTMSVSDVAGVGEFIPTSDFTGDKSGLFTVCNGYSVSRSDYTLYGTSTIIYNFPTLTSDAVCDGNWVYVILQDGRTYKLEQPKGIKDFSSYVLSGDQRDGIYLGDYCTGSSIIAGNRITVDSDRNIYVSSATDDKTFKIDHALYTSVEYTTNTQISGSDIIPLFSGRSDFYILAHPSALYCNITKVNSPVTYSYGLGQSVPSGTLRVYGISQLVNNNFLLLYVGDSTADTLYLKEYNRTTSIGTIVSAPLTHSPTNAMDLLALNNGVVIYSNANADVVNSYSTISGSIGYFSDDSGMTAPEVEYTDSSVSSNYNTYYNMSTVGFSWSLAVDETYIDTWVLTHGSNKLYSVYEYKVLLFSPDDIFVTSYTIPYSSWKYQTYTFGIFGDGDYVNTGNAAFTSLTGNGTWTLKLTENNKITGAVALLDTDTFEILNQNTPSGSTPIDTSSENAATNFIQSPYMVALIIIGVVAFQFGRSRDGAINGTAMIVLVPLAVSICVIMGLLPMWILYTMILGLIAFVAIKMSGGGGN